QYTIPNQEKIDMFKNGDVKELTTREKHTRECFVVLEENADSEMIKEEIIKMPNYFADYDTTVHFVSQSVLDSEHKLGMPHGGRVIRVGHTSETNQETIEYSLNLDSNPEFTASVLVAYARSCARLASEGQIGALTIFDVAPKYITNKENHLLRNEDL
ncbi:diaminopimelate dehydrogenase, partial [Acinetobacter baumannii]|nr:diaminopimelate dehydrogenase [Acinetobacter baumannii]